MINIFIFTITNKSSADLIGTYLTYCGYTDGGVPVRLKERKLEMKRNGV